MAKLSDWKLEKAKMRMGAAQAKPERPRIQEQIDNAMFGELSEKWKGNKGGNSGDALISGLTAGLKKGSFAEDKDRNKKVIEFTEKMKNMVASQNEELFKQEKLSTARNSVTPRIMAYLESYKNMSANDRKVYLQNSMDEYNQSAGTSYKIIDATGSEPWKVIVSDGEEIQPLDLMSFIKTPEEKKLEYYLQSNEVKQAEQEMQSDDRYSKSRRQEESPLNIQQKKTQLVKSGDIPQEALLFDELPDHESKKWQEDLRVERDKGRAAKNGIKAIEEMGKIFQDYPNISTSLAKWASSKGDSPFDNLIKGMVNQDQRNALIQLEKHAARLAIGTIEQFKGMRPTDILKKLIKETNPGSNFTYEAFVPIANQYLQEFEEQALRSEEANRGLMKRYVPTYENIGKSSKQVNSPRVDFNALDQEEQALLKEREALING
jgi:hypothetical protein